VGPGGDKGRLVLADGSAILLDSAANGKLADQGTTEITKDSGRIFYRAGQDRRKQFGLQQRKAIIL